MTKKDFWRKMKPKERDAFAKSVRSTPGHLRQVFMYDRRTSADLARDLFNATGGVIGAHEFCPGAFSEADRLCIQSGDTAA